MANKVPKNDNRTRSRLNTKLETPIVDAHCHMFGQSLLTGRIHELSASNLVTFVDAGRKQPLVRVPAQVILLERRLARGEPIIVPKVLHDRAVMEWPASSWPPKPGPGTLPDGSHHDRVLTKPSGAKLLSFGMGKPADCLPNVAGSVHRFVKYFAGDDGVNAVECLRGIPAQGGRRAAVPLLLDMGYTPLATASFDLAGPLAWVLGLPSAKGDKHGYYDDVNGAKEFVWFDDDPKAFNYTIENLAKVAAGHPYKIWPVVCFDPRRPNGLDAVQKAVKTMGFVGVKLYSRCGWMVQNNALIHGNKGAQLDARLEALWKFALAEDLPIVNHTSPTGFPPNPCLVLPRRYEQGSGFAPAPAVEGPRLWADDGAEIEFVRWCEAFAYQACWEAYNYCHYIQHTVSPYAWEPVLHQHKKLRLNLAHSGSEKSLLARYGPLREDPRMAAGVAELEENPMVASGAEFQEHLFRKCCLRKAEDLAIGWSNSKLGLGYLYSATQCHKVFFDLFNSCSTDYSYKSLDEIKAMVAKAVRAELGRPEWKKVLDEWGATYKLDWLSKIIELQNRFPNVYSDLAYLTGGDAGSFKKLLGALVDDALGTSCAAGRQDNQKILRKRQMIGTDWFMIEMSKMDAHEFWRRVTDVIPATHVLWDDWASRNALRFLNLEKRMNAMEAWYKSQNAGLTAPTWWADVRKFYQREAKAKH